MVPAMWPADMWPILHATRWRGSEGDQKVEPVTDGSVEGIGSHTLRNRAVAGIMIVIKLRCTETKIVLFSLGFICLFLIINFEIVLCVWGRGETGGAE